MQMKTNSQEVSPGKVSALKWLTCIYVLLLVLVNFLKKIFALKIFLQYSDFSIFVKDNTNLSCKTPFQLLKVH